MLLFLREVCGFYVSIVCARGMQSSFFVSSFEVLYQLCNISTHASYADLGLA